MRHGSGCHGYSTVLARGDTKDRLEAKITLRAFGHPKYLYVLFAAGLHIANFWGSKTVSDENNAHN